MAEQPTDKKVGNKSESLAPPAAGVATRESVPKGDDVVWFEEKSGLHASTMSAYRAWLRDGEFPIIVGKNPAGDIAVYTSFARCLYWNHGDKACDGVLYLGADLLRAGGYYLIPLNPYNSTILSSDEHKPFLLTVSQCAALVLIAKECQLRAPRNKDASIERRGGNPLAEKLMALFRRDGRPLDSVTNFEDYSSDEDD